MRISQIMAIAGVLTFVGCGTAVEPARSPAEQTGELGGATQGKPANRVPVEHRVDGGQVTSTMRLSQAKARHGEEIEVSVELKIAPLWEIHTLDAQPESTATRLELIAPLGIAPQGEWSTPTSARSVIPDGHPVYIGKAVFTRTLTVNSSAVAGAQEIVCQVRFQVCNERQCLQPKELTLKVPLLVETR